MSLTTPLVLGTLGCTAAALLAGQPAFAASAASPARIVVAPPRTLLQFVVVDPQSGAPAGAGSYRLSVEARGHAPVALVDDKSHSSGVPPFDPAQWRVDDSRASGRPVATIRLVEGEGVTVRIASAQGAAPSTRRAAAPGRQPQDIYIRVVSTRLNPAPPVTSAGQTRTSQDLHTFTNATAENASALTRGQSGVASDSNGQQHVRGEHAEISYVVDGVPLPDTLSGRQGSVVVPSTIESLDILTGAYSPEFGGQTAAVLDINTLPSTTKSETDLTMQGGGFATFNTDLTTSGPIGDPRRHGSFVFDAATTSTDNFQEPQQPDDDTAHNAGHTESYFGKVRISPADNDVLTVTLNHTPTDIELSNRTGLPSSFSDAGEGYGFLGLRNADGMRPASGVVVPGALGSATDVLPTQEQDGMAINEHDISEFAVVSWRHNTRPLDVLQLSATELHSAQTVDNNSPTINLANLPVDNSIEYNPDSVRNVYHSQFTGDYSTPRGSHQIKTGVIFDAQHGQESYQLIPASQLALDDLAATDIALAPAGSFVTDSKGNQVLDVDGFGVYQIKPGATAPTVNVSRTGFYTAAYAQDTWTATKRLTANYGARVDWYKQSENLGEETVDLKYLSPRLNLSYALAPMTPLRLSYNKLFNTPPLAQGAIVGQPIQPETLDQYDASVEHRVAPGQTVKLAYYYKHISDQVDTGLLINGSQIGIFSAVNFQYGAVHGIETSYDLTPIHGTGWDAFVNYSWSIAQPNGLTNTGQPAPQYNDHDQRNTVGSGIAYDWKGGANLAATLDYGSGLASSVIPPENLRQARTEVDLLSTTGNHLFGGRGGVGLDISNLFNEVGVINFDSGFSGTRFVQERRVLFNVFGSF